MAVALEDRYEVLLVDDDEHALKIEDRLSGFGFSFSPTTDSHEAIRMFHERHFDLVLVDLKMPQLDGVELIVKLKTLRPGVPFIIYSAHAEESFWQDKMQVIEGQYADVIEKPFPVRKRDIEELARTLAETIRKARRSVKSPFDITLTEYLGMEPWLSKEVRTNAWLMVREEILRYLDSRRAEWVLYCGGEILSDSNLRKVPPSTKELEEIAQDRDRVPFLFFRPPVVEETPWHAGTKKSWNQKRDMIPTIECRLEVDGRSTDWLSADLDTGSSSTFVSSDDVEIGPFDSIQSEEHLKRTYCFAVKPVRILIRGEQGGVGHANIRVAVVDNWCRSPFTRRNPSRPMLVGRDCLQEIPMTITLNTERQLTTVTIHG